MKINKMVAIILLVIIIFLQLEFFENSVQAKTTSKGTSIYMWEVDGINYSEYNEIVDYLNINKIYAYIGTANLDKKINYDVELLFQFSKNKNISTYIVYDENYEDQNENLTRIKQLIEEVNNYNKKSNYKISGIAIDSEFHTLSGYSQMSKEEQTQLFSSYVNAMKLAYQYANQYRIKYVVCIPVWLDKLDKSELEELIKDGCDYVQLMNYMFTGTGIEVLDLGPKFNTSNVIAADGMFAEMPNLTTIKTNELNLSKVTSSVGMFWNSPKLVGGSGTRYNENHAGLNRAHIDGGTSNPGYFTQR